MTTRSAISWSKIFLFYAIAFMLSALFNSGLLVPFYQKLTAGLLLSQWPFVPAGVGTLVAACLAFTFDKKLKRTLTFTGNSIWKNVFTAIVPMLVFTVIGIANKEQAHPVYYGLVFSFVALVYAVTEEIFWRNYLLDALRPVGSIRYSIIIGIL